MGTKLQAVRRRNLGLGKELFQSSAPLTKLCLLIEQLVCFPGCLFVGNSQSSRQPVAQSLHCSLSEDALHKKYHLDKRFLTSILSSYDDLSGWLYISIM